MEVEGLIPPALLNEMEANEWDALFQNTSLDLENFFSQALATLEREADAKVEQAQAAVDAVEAAGVALETVRASTSAEAECRAVETAQPRSPQQQQQQQQPQQQSPQQPPQPQQPQQQPTSQQLYQQPQQQQPLQQPQQPLQQQRQPPREQQLQGRQQEPVAHCSHSYPPEDNTVTSTTDNTSENTVSRKYSEEQKREMATFLRKLGLRQAIRMNFFFIHFLRQPVQLCNNPVSFF